MKFNKKAALFLLLALAILLYVFRYEIKSKVFNILKSKIRNDFQTTIKDTTPQATVIDTLFQYAIITDVHNNTQGLAKAINEINGSNIDFVIGLGDYTNVGTEDELKNIKKELSKLNKKYYLLPGDHDLWNGRDKQQIPLFYYKQHLQYQSQTITHKDVKFIFIDNSDLYKGVEENKITQLNSDLANDKDKLTIVSMHKAVYHPLTIHTMGYINETINPEVVNQASEIRNSIAKIKDKNIVTFNGDLHASGKYTYPNSKIAGYTIGALAKDKNFETPRYAIVKIGKDFSTHVEYREIK